MKAKVFAAALLLGGCAMPVFDQTTWGNLVTAQVAADDIAARGCPAGAVHRGVTLPLRRAAASAQAATPGSPVVQAATLLVEAAVGAEKPGSGVFCREQLALISGGIATLLKGYNTTRGVK